jgi:integrase/recombinase XerD
LHPSACTALADYLRRRQDHWAGRPVSSYVFVSSWGNRLDVGDIHRTFYALSRQIGLRGHADRHGPRIHDLRHRFAAKTLWRWYRTGEDPERRLPILSAYLGHVHVSDTYWYLSALTGKSLRVCPVCHQGKMMVIKRLVPARRGVLILDTS